MIPTEEIEKIVVYLSPAMYKGSNFHIMGFEAYHYASVRLKSGEELVLTCLLAPKLYPVLKKWLGSKVVRKKRIFNVIR